MQDQAETAGHSKPKSLFPLTPEMVRRLLDTQEDVPAQDVTAPFHREATR
ncbi:MAG: hypothetical protein AAFQ64_01135 [Pseudomonadota bacterium]